MGSPFYAGRSWAVLVIEVVDVGFGDRRAQEESKLGR